MHGRGAGLLRGQVDGDGARVPPVEDVPALLCEGQLQVGEERLGTERAEEVRVVALPEGAQRWCV